jgi:Uma2 family endonuclease
MTARASRRYIEAMAELAVTLAHPPTLADIDALPPHMKGEIIDGVFYAMTRPRGAHQSVAGAIHADLYGPYQRGRGGPGGWWILPEPGIEFVNSPEVSPDVAAWRRARMPSLSNAKSIRVAPDWVCEVLSNSTRRYDLRTKKPFYARAGVSWLWVVDPAAQLVTAHRLEHGNWVEVGVWSDEGDARIPPFDDVPLDVSAWWEGVGDESP